MAKDYNLSGTHVINRWVWSNLKATLPEDFVKYTTPGTPSYNLVPIIPSQQLPTFIDIAGGAPFMIYNYNIEMSGDVWERRDQIGYVIYDDNEARLRRIHNFIVQLLGRMDWAAADCNNYIKNDPLLNEFDFKYIRVDSAAGPQPFESEGGRHGALIMATAMYTRDMIGTHGPSLGMRA